MTMLPLEKVLATHVYWACGDWPTEAKRNLCDAIQAALKEQRDVERAEICDRDTTIALLLEALKEARAHIEIGFGAQFQEGSREALVRRIDSAIAAATGDSK